MKENKLVELSMDFSVDILKCFGTVIRCIFNGFDDFLLKIIDLPYLLYLFFSLIISLILIFVIRQKAK